jgi:beta-glucosidase
VTGRDGKLIGPPSESSWLYVYPEGLRGILKWIDKRYNHPIIYVFENGVSVPKENDMPIQEAINDTFRVNFYKDYIQNAIEAMTTDGVDLRGYFAWSLMDNFEWADGYSTRFGMTYVDYKDNQKRYIKDSLAWYSQFTKTGNINATFTNPDAAKFASPTLYLQEKYVFLQ